MTTGDAAPSRQELAAAFPAHDRFEVGAGVDPTGGRILARHWTTRQWQVIDLVAPDAIDGDVDQLRRVLGRLSTHPNIESLLDSGTGPLGPYLIREHYPGGTLADRLSAGPLAPPALSMLASKLVGALDFAHSLVPPAVHAAISPEHVRFTESGEPVLVGFDVVRRPGIRPAPVAPEMLLGRPPTTATDLYLLGAVLFEAAQGRPPYGAPGVVDPERVLNDPPARLTRSDLAPRAAQAIQDMLSRDPDRRPGAMADVSSAFTRGTGAPVGDSGSTRQRPGPASTNRQTPPAASAPDPPSGRAGQQTPPGPAVEPTRVRGDRAAPPDQTLHAEPAEAPSRRPVALVLAASVLVVALAGAGAAWAITRGDPPTPTPTTTTATPLPPPRPDSTIPAPSDPTAPQVALQVVGQDDAMATMRLAFDSAAADSDYLIQAAAFAVDPLTGANAAEPERSGFLSERGTIVEGGAGAEQLVTIPAGSPGYEFRLENRQLSQFICYRLVPADGAGAGPPSNQVCAPGDQPSAPRLLTDEVVEAGRSLTLEWVDTSDNEASFLVLGFELDADRDSTIDDVVSLDANSTSLTLEPTPGWCYAVFAMNAANHFAQPRGASTDAIPATGGVTALSQTTCVAPT